MAYRRGAAAGERRREQQVSNRTLVRQWLTAHPDLEATFAALDKNRDGLHSRGLSSH